MKAFVVKILLSLLFIALVTSNIVAESRLHKEYKNGKIIRKWYLICKFIPPEKFVKQTPFIDYVTSAGVYHSEKKNRGRRTA